MESIHNPLGRETLDSDETVYIKEVLTATLYGKVLEILWGVGHLPLQKLSGVGSSKQLLGLQLLSQNTKREPSGKQPDCSALGTEMPA